MPGKIKGKSKKAAKKVASKAPAKKKAATKSATTAPVARKKVANKKGAPAKKRAPRKSSSEYWETNEHGFRVGSDLAIIVDAMIEGGSDRREVISNAREVIGNETVNGQPKNISSSITTLLPKLEERGYKVESHWRLVPPARPKKVKKS